MIDTYHAKELDFRFESKFESKETLSNSRTSIESKYAQGFKVIETKYYIIWIQIHWESRGERLTTWNTIYYQIEINIHWVW